MVGGVALRVAADAVIARAREMAGVLMEAAAADIEFKAGKFTVAGTDKQMPITEVAKAFFAPAGPVLKFGLGLEAAGTYSGAPGGAPNYPNGCQACEVEVDPDTGAVTIARFAAVDDLGMIINPMICEGQIHGGIAQGLGQALCEAVAYDPQTGQLLSGSFLDYAMPRAEDVPEVVSELAEVPALTNPLGIKGIGESGTIGAPPTIVNAVLDALRPLGIEHIDMPLTPSRVWNAIRAAKQRSSGVVQEDTIRHDQDRYKHAVEFERGAADRLRPPPAYERMIRDTDVYVPMRDGVKLCVDIYRPDTTEKLPALLAFAIYNKDFQGPDVAKDLPPQPAWTPLWTGPLEAGDTHFLVSRGYIHVIGSPRGVGKSEGGGSRQWDSYDLIEWIAAQPWCDGNVGMVGISGFGAEQFHVAKQQPPHLKAIFPFDPRGAYGTLGSFREEYPGGVLHVFRYLVGHFSAMHQHRGAPGALPEPREAWWREAMANPDYRMYPNILNMIAQKGQHMPPIFDLLHRSLRDGRRRPSAPKPISPTSRCRSTPARAGTGTRTRPISTARRTTSPPPTRRRS